MKTVKDAIAVYQQLSPKDRTAFYITLSNQFTTKSLESMDILIELRYPDGICCPHCGSIHYVKNGHRSDGTQRYLCRDCKKSFLISSNSIISGSHKRLELWKRYFQCMMDQKSLKESSEICGISMGTAFHWRHKILDALKDTANCVSLGGIVEADETYTPLSFKGNHSKSKNFQMPRIAHKRGKDSHTKGLSNEQVCIPCAVDQSGVPISRVTKLGKVSSKCIETMFLDRIDSKAIFCTDHEKAYRSFTEQAKLRWNPMGTGRHVTENYGIQRINAYHSKLKKFLRNRNGVATKCLPNYLVWHDLMFCSVRSQTEVMQQLWGMVLAEKIHLSYRECSERPAFPVMSTQGSLEVAA